MTLRKAHGDHAAALLVAETLPPDEQPAGVPAPSRPAPSAGRRPDGRFTRGNPWAAAGGRERARRAAMSAALSATLGLTDVGEDFRRYLEQAVEFASAELARLAETVGGGFVGPGPASMVQSAALALAASRFLYAKGSAGIPKLLGQAARLADRSRQGLLTAHELCAREAKARREAGHGPDPWAAVEAAFGRAATETGSGRAADSEPTPATTETKARQEGRQAP